MSCSAKTLPCFALATSGLEATSAKELAMLPHVSINSISTGASPPPAPARLQRWAPCGPLTMCFSRSLPGGILDDLAGALQGYVNWVRVSNCMLLRRAALVCDQCACHRRFR
jgi:hypothetical protein